MTQIAILGAGMAGLGAAYRLRQEGVSAVVYDKLGFPGGHATSFTHEEGFIFDDGPHVSFTKDERLQKMFAENVGGEYETLHAYVNNYWKGRWVKHPAQCNLHGLPEDLVVDVLRDFVHAQHTQEEAEIRNYEDWLLASYGRTFAENFPMVYTRKFHTTEARNMSTDWLGPRLYRPELEEVFRGAISSKTADVHYVSHFRYPTHNGFAAYLDPFIRDTDIRLGRKVVRIDPEGRAIHFDDGERAGYEHLVSSLPLPELLPLIDGAPDEVLEATSRLAATECVTVNVGIDREDISEAHWTYFYDPEISFTRLSFPHLFSPNTTPPGAGSVQAEVYFSPKYKPRDVSADECIDPVIRDLRACGYIRENDQILFSNARVIPYANVIFDLDRAPALEIVQGYLSDLGIPSSGRYGEWGYHWTDDAFKSGEGAAQTVLDSIYSGQGVIG
jgi:protoporphyrinogen oxidase